MLMCNDVNDRHNYGLKPESRFWKFMGFCAFLHFAFPKIPVFYHSKYRRLWLIRIPFDRPNYPN